MKVRVVWAIIMILGVGAVVWFANNLVFTILTTVVGLIAMSEVIHAKKNVPTIFIILMMLSMLFTGYYSYTIGMLDSNYYIILFVAIMVLLVLYSNLEKFNFNDASVVYALIMYVLLGFNALITIKLNYDLIYFIYPIIIGMLADTFGYFGGKLFGKNKLIPGISPNKTVEGALSATLVAGAASYFYLSLFDYSTFTIVIISVIMVILSQIGDLVASSIKRTYDIKDYSKLIPGHGGVLDRIDSILFNFIVFSIILMFV